MAKPTLDDDLLARMTGGLGDPRRMSAIGRAIGERIADGVKIGFRRATGITLKLGVGALKRGRRTELLSAFGDEHVLCEASVEGWSEEIQFAAESGLAIMLTEMLLGGAGKAPEAPRALTEIEKDVAAVLFEQTAAALREAVCPNDDGRSACGPAFTGPFRRDSDGVPGDHALLLVMEMELAGQPFGLQLVLPQRALIRTSVCAAAPEPEAAGAARPEWVEQLTRQVQTSSVALEADIRLAPITLGSASRLKPGDVLPFAGTEEEMRVLVKANGKNLFWGEFGKSGDRYMLRLAERYGGEADFMRNLTG